MTVLWFGSPLSISVQHVSGVVQHGPVLVHGPGRDGPFGPPPGQIPASGFPAPGSHLGSTGREAYGGPWMVDLGRRKRVALSKGITRGVVPTPALTSLLQ